MDVGLAPRHHFAVEPDDAVAIVIGNKFGHALRSSCAIPWPPDKIRSPRPRTGAAADSNTNASHEAKPLNSLLKMTCHDYQSAANKST
jgi:hypothetical protein